MREQLLFSILSILLAPSFVAAQSADSDNSWGKVDFYLPEAASLMKYVDYPVGHSTGIPDITIPLYDIRSGSLELPLNLSFHIDDYVTFGQMPGVAGAGWSLSSDIMISRKINGKDDLFKISGMAASYNDNPNIPSSYAGDTGYPRSRGKDSSEEKLYLLQLLSGWYDEEPDKYYYNLLGKRGAFYFRKESSGIKPVPVPYDGVTIDLDSDYNFIMIDDIGNKYYFDIRDYEIVQNPPDNKPVYLNWKCSRIVSASGVDVITFTYESQDIEGVISRHESTEVYDAVYDRNNYIGTVGGSMPDSYHRYSGPKFIEHLGGKVTGTSIIPVSKLYVSTSHVTYRMYPIADLDIAIIWQRKNLKVHNLKSITFRGGKVEFSYIQPTGCSKRQLTNIKVLDSSNMQIHTINFTQDIPLPDHGGNGVYPENLSTNYSRRLKSLYIDDAIFTFDYGRYHYGGVHYTPDSWGTTVENETMGLSSVPRHFVYFQPGNPAAYAIVMPNPDDPEGQVKLPVDHAFPYNISGTGIPDYVLFRLRNNIKLLTIGYPTGGKAEFIFSNNRFRSSENQIKGIGGYRIDNIKYYNGNDSVHVREKIYKYGPNEDGTGYVRFEPTLDEENSSFMTRQNVKIMSGSTSSSFITQAEARLRTFYPHTNRNLHFDTGSFVYYEEVAEYDSEGGEYTGKTVYKFKIDKTALFEWYHYQDPHPAHPFPIEREEWDIIQPESVTSYKYISADSFEWVKKVNYTYQKYVDPVKIFCGRIWDPNKIIIVQGNGTVYEYYSKGGGVSSAYYRYKGLETGCMQLHEETVEEKGDNGVVRSASTTYYYDSPVKYRPSRVTQSNSDGTTTTIQTLYPQDYTPGGSHTFIAELLNKNIVSVPIETIVRKNKKIISGTHLRYDSKGNVISVYNLEEANLTESVFRLSNKSSAGKYVNNSRTVFNPDSRYKLNMTIQYDQYNNKPVQVTDKTGRAVAYLWGYEGRYPIAEIKNSTYDDVLAAGGWTSSTYNSGVVSQKRPSAQQWTLFNGLRTHANMKEAFITLYEYEPLRGISKITDPRGFITEYEYDSNGRLKTVGERNDEEAGKTLLQSFEYKYGY